MSKTTHIQRVAKSVWHEVLHDHKGYFKKSWDLFLLRKLKQARFTKLGSMKFDSVGLTVVNEFPSLYKSWKEKMGENAEQTR